MDLDEQQELTCLLLEGVPEERARRLAARKADTVSARWHAFGRPKRHLVYYLDTTPGEMWGAWSHGSSLTQRVVDDDEVERNERLDLIWNTAKEILSDHQMDAFTAVYLYGMTIKEAAEHLGAPERTIEARTSQSRKKIRRHLHLSNETDERARLAHNKRQNARRRRLREKETTS